MKNKCLYCGKPVKRYGSIFCSSKCSSDYRYKDYINHWLNGEKSGTICVNCKKEVSGHVRRYLLEKADYKCEKCGWGERNPITGNIMLEIHHKDGNRLNNTENNLEVLCPNCHSLTPTFRALNAENFTPKSKQTNYCIDCGKVITHRSKRCSACSSKHKKENAPKKEKPISREELKVLIRNKSFTEIGKKFGVTDSAIRKWCDYYNLPRYKHEILKYSDENWRSV